MRQLTERSVSFNVYAEAGGKIGNTALGPIPGKPVPASRWLPGGCGTGDSFLNAARVKWVFAAVGAAFPHLLGLKGGVGPRLGNGVESERWGFTTPAVRGLSAL